MRIKEMISEMWNNGGSRYRATHAMALWLLSPLSPVEDTSVISMIRDNAPYHLIGKGAIDSSSKYNGDALFLRCRKL